MRASAAAVNGNKTRVLAATGEVVAMAAEMTGIGEAAVVAAAVAAAVVATVMEVAVAAAAATAVAAAVTGKGAAGTAEGDIVR